VELGERGTSWRDWEVIRSASALVDCLAPTEGKLNPSLPTWLLPSV